jgi:DNA-binding NarL/FixJ family response regulator
MQQRPHRPARSRDEAASELRADVAAGKLDGRAVDAVLAAAGLPVRPSRRVNPGGLSDREVEVLRLIAHGHPNREIAAALGITPKTVGHHVQHIYDKVGISTRAAAAIFAVEHRFL